MVVLRAQKFYSGTVPSSLSNLFERKNLDDSRPSKRRKIAGPQSLKDVNGLTESGIPLGYIPVARLVLDLNFAGPGSTGGLQRSDTDLLYSLPVLLRRAGSFRWEPDGTFNLELATTTTKEVIFTDSFSRPDLLSFGEHLHLASLLFCADHYHEKAPTVCYKSTIRLLPDRKSLALETVILWKDTLDIPIFNRQQDPAVRVFNKYVLQDQQDDSSVQRRWLPRDFYNNVHVPRDTPNASEAIKCDLVDCQLYPFQRRAVRWLLGREGVSLQPDGRIVPIAKPQSGSLPTSFQQFTDADGRVCFCSRLFMIVAYDLTGWYDGSKRLRGGILAEEMGLGKTVEMISLICLNRRSLNANHPIAAIDNGNLISSDATLIITPPAILEQWKQEIATHSPGLSVFHYKGLQLHQELAGQGLLENISEHDVVLTTYNVLSREVYHSVDAPRRNLRYEKRFEPRKSPLVRISWWRVCLDEAQMIENGVNNAAKVARLIPRQIAWAVSGTPIRKDISDLHGLLLFLDYKPFCERSAIWNKLCHAFQPVLGSIVNTIAIRHSKDLVRRELDLPPQKRVVITVPFTAIEEQHYGQLYEQMCEECGLDMSGAPLNNDWDPDDPSIIDTMRTWLTRLRQTCLHPEVAGRNRRVLGTGSGPLRSVAEVLEVMIDQNDTLIRAEERVLLQSQLRRGQLLENATRRWEALELWLISLERASQIVRECRSQLDAERSNTDIIAESSNQDRMSVDATSDTEEADKNSRLGTYRQRLRAALEIQHICYFFIGNVYYQIKTDPKLTVLGSEEFKSFERREEEAYEAAKLVRKEMLAEISRKVNRYMRLIKDKSQRKFVQIPEMKLQLQSRGIESRRLFDKLEDFCDAMNTLAIRYDEWRAIMAKLLSLPLIDQEEEAELKGNEYEESTKHQDEMYVYMEALRTMLADRHGALTGQKNILIAHEVKSGVIQARKGEGPSPSLYLSIMNTRSDIMPDPQLGSLRGIISELRSLATSLDWQANGGSSRARSELELVNSVINNASQMAAEQAKSTSGLEREVEMFRDTMNSRLEYYRQLQQISDTVAPYDEESVGKPLNEEAFLMKRKQEESMDEKISAHKAKRRYLIHLRNESGSDDSSKICIICQSSFEIGVLTVCGHKYCKDCLRMWWNLHRTCPTCKSRLKANDFHQITYKPQEFVAQEENASTKIEPGHASDNLIYTDISSGLLREIKGINLTGFFGTKIDTLARHIMWLRKNDPGTKAVVFSQYKNFLGVLGTAFSLNKIGHSSVDSKGGIEKFKSDPAVECFLLHARAHSSGLNLVNATHVFLCEPLINTAIELQAIARVHRIGQHSRTTVWMYLVSDTVEESIYNLSVSRRLSHIYEKEKEVEGNSGTLPEKLTEAAIDSANSMEIQDAALSKLMAGNASGGELVKKDDLWQCLFGGPSQKTNSRHPNRADSEVGRFLRGEAADQRRD